MVVDITAAFGECSRVTARFNEVYRGGNNSPAWRWTLRPRDARGSWHVGPGKPRPCSCPEEHLHLNHLSSSPRFTHTEQVLAREAVPGHCDTSSTCKIPSDTKAANSMLSSYTPCPIPIPFSYLLLLHPFHLQLQPDTAPSVLVEVNHNSTCYLASPQLLHALCHLARTSDLRD